MASRRRFVTLGLLNDIPVSIVHTETSETIRVISFRRATTHEATILFVNIADQLPPPPDDGGRRRPGLVQGPGIRLSDTHQCRAESLSGGGRRLTGSTTQCTGTPGS